MAATESETDQYIRELAADLIEEGFASDREIVDLLSADVACWGSFDKALPRLERLVRKLAVEHRRHEAQWSQPTDCDRLDAAFTAMRRRGVLARQHYGFDKGDGHANMRCLAEEPTVRPTPCGYAFYTTQETGGAREYGKLYIDYEALTEGDEATAEVGKRVAEALREAGLRVEWTGDPHECVGVTDLKWQRRRPGMTLGELHREIEENIANGSLDPQAAVTAEVWWSGEKSVGGPLTGMSRSAAGRMTLYARRDRSANQKGLSEEEAVG